MATEYDVLFVDINALFDTRMGAIVTLDAINKTEHAKSILNEQYFLRKMDVFENVDKDEYEALFASGDKRILHNARITPVLKYITEFVYDSTIFAVEAGGEKIPKVIINTYPFKLLEDELNLIKKAVIYKTNERAIVEFVFKSDSELTPAYLRDNVRSVIKYRYVDWLEGFGADGTFKKRTMPTVELLVPAIYLGQLPDDNMLKEMAAVKNTTPFKEMERMLNVFVNAKYMNISFFCLLDEDKIHERIRERLTNTATTATARVDDREYLWGSLKEVGRRSFSGSDRLPSDSES